MKAGDRVLVTKENANGVDVYAGDTGTVISSDSPSAWRVRMDILRKKSWAHPDGSHWSISEQFLELLPEPKMGRTVPDQGRRVRVCNRIEGTVVRRLVSTNIFWLLGDGLGDFQSQVFDMADPQITWEYVASAKKPGDMVTDGRSIRLMWDGEHWVRLSTVLPDSITTRFGDAEHAAGRYANLTDGGQA